MAGGGGCVQAMGFELLRATSIAVEVCTAFESRRDMTLRCSIGHVMPRATITFLYLPIALVSSLAGDSPVTAFSRACVR